MLDFFRPCATADHRAEEDLPFLLTGHCVHDHAVGLESIVLTCEGRRIIEHPAVCES